MNILKLISQTLSVEVLNIHGEVSHVIMLIKTPYGQLLCVLHFD